MSSKAPFGKPQITTFEKINSFHKLLICIALAFTVYFIVDIEHIDTLTHLMIGWDTFSFCMVITTWLTFFITQAKQIREQARIQDPSRTIIFFIVLISTFASFLAVLILVVIKKGGHYSTAWRLPIAIVGMVFSWLLIHSIFALRYAHVYYGDHETKPDIHAGGLLFPNDETPGYLDFAYFSFVLGMTFQVSDVQITSKRFRRMALLHGMISFGFDTTMIALTINIVSGFGT